VSLVYDILDRYLYKEDVQALARERGLPTSWPKDEIVYALLRSGRFDPGEALAYLNVRELRRLCQEYRLRNDGDRDKLIARVIEAIFDEEEPEEDDEEEPKVVPTPRRKPKDPRPTANESVLTPTRASIRLVGRMAGGPSLLSAVSIPREHPETTGPWAAVSIIGSAVVLAGFYFLISALGLADGLVAGVILAIAVSAALLTTSHRWVPWLARVGHRDSSR
jgi:hypothetical protein